jgi:hypothetical protein
MSHINTLSLGITESFDLVYFEINAIRVVPSTSANIEITITGSNGKLYDRIFTIDGEEYADWVTDDYLYTYIKTNISTIFGV